MPKVNKLMLLGRVQSKPSRQNSFNGETAILSISSATSTDTADIPSSDITVLVHGTQAVWCMAHISEGNIVHIEAELRPLGRTAQGASVAYLIAQSVQLVADSEQHISAPKKHAPPQATAALGVQTAPKTTCH